MRDHLVTGISWVSFPCEASYRWWLVVTPLESKFIFESSTGESFTVELDDEKAVNMLRVIGAVAQFPNAENLPA